MNFSFLFYYIFLIFQIINKKVLLTLTSLENVIDLYSFINLFTQYGADLIELAHLSGERQNVFNFYILNFFIFNLILNYILIKRI